jgi:hypothetical protein
MRVAPRSAALVISVGLFLACSAGQDAGEPAASTPGNNGDRTHNPSDPATEGETGASLSALQSCPVTPPNGLVPPGEPADPGYLGNGDLWTVLWPNGLVLVPPDDIRADGWLEMKFPWWRGPGIRGLLHIRGRERTLGLRVQARADGYGLTGFNASAISFPVEGCYEIVARVGGTQLTFITMVRRCSALDELPPTERDKYTICRA